MIKNGSGLILPPHFGKDVIAVYKGDTLVWYKGATVDYKYQSGTYEIPSYAVFIDVIAVGGGASGQTGNGANNQTGKGGKHGVWASTTLERGIDLPWATKEYTVGIGAGGTRPADSDHADPNPGNATVVSFVGRSSFIASGGSGKASGRDGEDAGVYGYRGTDYYGGSGGTSGSNEGSPPGGGGYGGSGGIFGSRSRGYAGAAGSAWLVFRSY